MREREGVRLPGLEGSNPLGFLAAVGAQALFEGEDRHPLLWWTDDPVPVAVISNTHTVEEVVEQALRTCPDLAKSRAFSPNLHSGGDKTIKYPPEYVRRYLEQAQEHPLGGALASALIAEGSIAGTGNAKPTDLHFAAGRKNFLEIARRVLIHAREDVLAEALLGEWTSRNISSLGWDPKSYVPAALSALKPGQSGKKHCYPGVEALALIGLSRLPVFAGRNRTLTVGCSGSWKDGAFTWPIWTRPAGCGAVSTLLFQIGATANTSRARWYPGWGVDRVFRSQIRRSDTGGQGTFGPGHTIWQAQ